MTEEVVDPAPEPAPEPEPAPPEEAPPEDPHESPERSSRRAIVIAAIVVGALLTGFFAWGATRYSKAQGDLDDIERVRQVAGEFGAATLTYDYRDLAPFKRRMNAYATGTFRRQLQEGLKGLETLITQLKSRSEATVKRIYVSEIDEHGASALVVVEARAQNGEDPPRTLEEAYIELQLVKVDGRWRIDGVSTLDLGQAAAGPAVPGAPATTTTVK